jgi:methyl-accepting chemotaxis protein
MVIFYLSMSSISLIAGNAQVVNYDGIVRGATQKLIKEELMNSYIKSEGITDVDYTDDALIARLDKILQALDTGEEFVDGGNTLTLEVLDDSTHKADIKQLISEWGTLKAEITNVRSGVNPQHMYDLSQSYFKTANDTVFAAQSYSDSLVAKVSKVLLISNLGFLVLILVLAIFIMRGFRAQKKAAAAQAEAEKARQKADQVTDLVRDISGTFNQVIGGDTSVRVSEEKFEGIYKSIAADTNHFIVQIMKIINGASSHLKSYAIGDMSEEMPDLPGDLSVLSEAIQVIHHNLSIVTTEVGKLYDHFTSGDLEYHVHESGYTGDWLVLMKGLNGMTTAVQAPIGDIQLLMSKMLDGDLSYQITDKYQGRFSEIIQAANNTINMLAKLINEISVNLGAIAKQDLTVHMHHNYKGDFSSIADSINELSMNMAGVVANIINASATVKQRSSEIANSSESLAQGATDQTASVERLLENIKSSVESTQNEEEISSQAWGVVDSARAIILSSQQKMENLVAIIDEIRETSTNISSISKEIGSIAFQTNLLSLNASVEAANAGEHGRGFSVVAGEVQSLAKRSADNAQHAEQLIGASIAKINQGVAAVSDTRDALTQVVGITNQVADMVKNIADSTQESLQQLRDIESHVSDISTIAQSNAVTSKENAVASQELHNQSDMMNDVVDGFKVDVEAVG